MSTASSIARIYRHYRAPRVDGAALVEPALHSSADLLAKNRSLLEDDFVFGDSSRHALMHAARQQIVRLARQYTAPYRDVQVAELTPQTPILMSGHQPTLFHPGVWFKNVALAALVQKHSAIGIHLLVDNDVTAGPVVQVPQRDGAIARRISVPLDDARARRPFEEWDICSMDRFCASGAEIEQLIAPITSDPIIRQLWPDAIVAGTQAGNLGQAVSQARHLLESRWQLQTLELPVSWLADTDAFRCFCSHLLSQADAFRQIHNDEVLRYRAAHHIRSHAHPVPLLREIDDWVEVPYWSWTAAQPVRQPLFVRHRETMELKAGIRGDVLTGPTADTQLVDWLADLHRQGVKIRPRALTNTMFARLIVSDLFLHGIGGAKYDELGDAICRQFFGIEPPQFMTLTATVCLPHRTGQVDFDNLRQLDGQLRDLWYHPDRHVAELTDCSPTDQQLVEEKRALVDSPPPAGNRKAWHDQVEHVNAQLRPSVAKIRQFLLEERARLAEQLETEGVMRWREYSLSLFPENRLKKVLLDLCSSSL